jgi:hypothetical protein
LNRIRAALSIRTKLLLSFMLVATFTGALGLNAVATGDRLNTSRDALYAESFGGTRLLVAWLDQARVSESDLSAYMFEVDPAIRTRLRADMASGDAQIANLNAQIDAGDADRAETQQLAALSQA